MVASQQTLAERHRHGRCSELQTSQTQKLFFDDLSPACLPASVGTFRYRIASDGVLSEPSSSSSLMQTHEREARALNWSHLDISTSWSNLTRSRP